MNVAGVKRVVLIAGIGTSPAVLTETVWALAHAVRPVIPDEIVVVTTAAGKRKVQSEILGGVWSDLKAALCRERIKGAENLRLGETSIRVLPDAEGNEIDDLRSAADNLRAADFMLGVVRQYTEDPTTVVYASIAGGRKTMSALLLSCMSLLGRADDKVFHVLTTPEATSLRPTFHFPRRGVKHEFQDAGRLRTISAAKVAIELFEVPFVPVRGWFQEKYRQLPPTYSALVRMLRAGGPQAVVFPEIELDFEGHGYARVLPSRTDARLSAVEFALLCVIASGTPRDAWCKRMIDLKQMVEAANFPISVQWNDTFVDSTRFRGDMGEAVGDLADCLSEIRKKLKRAGFPESETLAPKRNAAVTFPLANFRAMNVDLVPVDIRGCLLPESAGK